jgi:hypothetical protein
MFYGGNITWLSIRPQKIQIVITPAVRLSFAQLPSEDQKNLGLRVSRSFSSKNNKSCVSDLQRPQLWGRDKQQGLERKAQAKTSYAYSPRD